MDGMVTAFLFSAGAVVLAEMGDKTQLLAMAFAAKYKASKVMAGVFAATVMNHALAVAAGSFLMRFEAARIWIEAIAALSFIFFGLWTIRGDELQGEHERESKFGPALTVAIAFFIAEMGDKTQLATIAIATKFPGHPVATLAGTTTGMMIADGIGIVVGVALCKKIPERTVKMISAAVFVLFGFLGTYQVARDKLHLSLTATAIIIASLALVTTAAAWAIIKREQKPDA
jgi:putative Ca2+/H+ antiporter (TMEM165/GDT1 family)